MELHVGFPLPLHQLPHAAAAASLVLAPLWGTWGPYLLLQINTKDVTNHNVIFENMDAVFRCRLTPGLVPYLHIFWYRVWYPTVPVYTQNKGLQRDVVYHHG
jgi:hypothetical protein